MSTDPINRKPTQAEAIDYAIEARLMGINVCMPAIISVYDAKLGLAEVQPALMSRKVDEDAAPKPIIRDVPVQFPRSLKAGIKFPLAKGDSCLLVMSQRSLDKWITTGGVVDPDDPRKFHISDAIALVGLYPTNSPLPLTTEELDHLVVINDKGKVIIKEDGTVVIGNDTGAIHVEADGKVKLVSDGADEPYVLGNQILDMLDQILTELSGAFVTGGGGSPAIVNPAFTAAVVAIKAEFVDTSSILSTEIFGE